MMKYVVDLCKAKVIRAKDSAFISRPDGWGFQLRPSQILRGSNLLRRYFSTFLYKTKSHLLARDQGEVPTKNCNDTRSVSCLSM